MAVGLALYIGAAAGDLDGAVPLRSIAVRGRPARPAHVLNATKSANCNSGGDRRACDGSAFLCCGVLCGTSKWGGLNGHLEGDLLDYFCFSIATYTTFGIAMYTRVAPSGWWPVLGSERACSNRLVCFVHLPDDGAILGHRARQEGRIREGTDVTDAL